jgi:hypothetical protein
MKLARKAVMFPYMFVLLNWAAVAGLCQFLRGVDGTWGASKR